MPLGACANPSGSATATATAATVSAQQRLRRGRLRLAHTASAIGAINSAATSHWLEPSAAAHRRLEADEALVAHAVTLGRARVRQLHFVRRTFPADHVATQTTVVLRKSNRKEHGSAKSQDVGISMDQ